MLNLVETVGYFTQFAARVCLQLPRAVFRPAAWLVQLRQVLLGALPLGTAAGLALGVVVWMHLHNVLARFSAEQYLPQALALALVLEFAPTGAALIVAGRSGASLGAELGSMRLTEQLDALEVLGLSPLVELVAPRVLGCMIALPLLTVFLIYFALLGSFAAELLGGTMHWTQYQTEWLRGLRLSDVLPATLKTVAFGYLIGVTGCWFGMTADGGTESVGRAATRGVVVSTFLVLTSNVLLVRVIQLF